MQNRDYEIRRAKKLLGSSFDKGSGAFMIASRKKGAVSLHGDGTPYLYERLHTKQN